MKNSSSLSLSLGFAFLLLGLNLKAQPDDSTQTLSPEDRPVNLYLLDYPMNFKDGYYWPSLNQSIYTTAAIHETVNKTLGDLLEPIHPIWGKALTAGALLAFNIPYSYIPTGTAWQHQEAHRAVLRYHGIQSHNQANEFCFFCKRIATNQVLDQDLINFKRDYPADFIRNRGIGHEAQLEMIEQMKKDAFFYGTPAYRDVIPYLLNTYVVISYTNEFRQKDYDDAIDKRNANEPDPDIRDISGVEFTPWVYDLFKPDEPYDQRGNNGGPHPYGTGIDRYIGVEDLTVEELKYLKKESSLVWLNLISPHNFGFARFRATNPFNSQPMFWNFSVVHNLVGFGHVTDVNLYLQQHKMNLFFTYHNYKNKDHYFPGVTIEVHRYPYKKIFLTGALGAWIQPKDQRFFANTGVAGGYLKFGVGSTLAKKLEWFIDADLKSDGWVSGNVSLEPIAQIQFGINWLH